MTTTAKSLTEPQIRTLRSKAAQAGDFVQVAICDLALDGDFDADDYTTLSRREADRVAGMSRDEAVAECARVIADSEAQA